MRRRDVLRKVGAASAITLGAITGTAAGSGTGRTYLVTTDDTGERTVVQLADADRDGVSATAYCPHYCEGFECCSECADDCDEECGGCFCADPTC